MIFFLVPKSCIDATVIALRNPGAGPVCKMGWGEGAAMLAAPNLLGPSDAPDPSATHAMRPIHAMFEFMRLASRPAAAGLDVGLKYEGHADRCVRHIVQEFRPQDKLKALPGPRHHCRAPAALPERRNFRICRPLVSKAPSGVTPVPAAGDALLA